MSKREPVVILLGSFEADLISALNKEGIKVRFFGDIDNYQDLDGDILLIDKALEAKAFTVLKLKTMVPVAFHENQYFVNYEPSREHGFAFLYKNNDSYSQFAAIIRAVESFKFPYDWKNILSEVKSVVDRVEFNEFSEN